MKGKFDAYVLWPLAKMLQNWIVDWSTAHDFTVGTSSHVFDKPLHHDGIFYFYASANHKDFCLQLAIAHTFGSPKTAQPVPTPLVSL